MMNKYPAHIRKTGEDDTENEVQYVEEHCRAVAQSAGRALNGVGLTETAYLAGLTHDMGKYTDEMSKYLSEAAAGIDVQRGSVNHTFAGVRYFMEKYHNSLTEYQNMTSEFIAYAAGAHHGNFDCFGEGGKNGFLHRVKKHGIPYDEVEERFFKYCADKQELDERFSRAEKEVENSILKIVNMAERNEGKTDGNIQKEMLFYVGFMERLLLSAVIDGDRRDTAQFMSGTKFIEERSKEDYAKLWKTCLDRVEKKLEEFSDTENLNKARKWVSQKCRDAAENGSGVYRLNVPTGGGKTLSLLRFSLAHGAKWKKKRLIFISPLLSILDQNADVIRRYIEDDSIILEHHSNIVQTENDKEELDQREFFVETWEAPVIITTLVQFLNTMFSGKTSSIRRFHSLQDSIIMIDEVQTVPVKMLSLFCLAVNFLSEFCGATIVLSSATQPDLQVLDYPLHEPIFDMVPYDQKIWEIFKRTEIRNEGKMSLDEIAEFIKAALSEANSILVVCNKKSESEYLYRLVEDIDAKVYHLSAAMCQKHRKDVLEEMKPMLDPKGKKKILCISTQVIEAGVDVSFQRVIRLQAGMDSVVQAAGRCNRNAEAGTGMIAPVSLISCKGENLSHLKEIQEGKDATTSLLYEFSQKPEAFRNDLSSEEAISYYYRKLYRSMEKGKTDYITTYQGNRVSILDLLADNEKYADDRAEHAEEFILRQAFKQAGELFEVFDQKTTDVIVPYGEGKDIIMELNGEQNEYKIDHIKNILERAKPYTVSLYQYQIEQLKKEGVLNMHSCGAFWMMEHYDEKTGFTLQESELDFLEV